VGGMMFAQFNRICNLETQDRAQEFVKRAAESGSISQRRYWLNRAHQLLSSLKRAASKRDSSVKLG
jgi:hypothetical protein